LSDTTPDTTQLYNNAATRQDAPPVPVAAGFALATISSLLGLSLAIAAFTVGKPLWLVAMLWPTGTGLALVGLGWLVLREDGQPENHLYRNCAHG